MKSNKELTDREARRLSKWTFAKELECLNMYLHFKCVKPSQGVQSYKVRGSGANGKLYDVPVAPGQWFTTYGELARQLPLNQQIDENRVKTLLNVLADEKCTKFNIQDVLTYSKGCTKINVQGVPNLGIMISLVDITDEALFAQLENNPKYVQNLVFGCTKINVRGVQKLISKNTNNKNTNINTNNVGCDFHENLLTQLFGQIRHDRFDKKSFDNLADWNIYDNLPYNDQIFIYNIYASFGIDYELADLNTFKYIDFLRLIDDYKAVMPQGMIIGVIQKGLDDILGMASRGELEYIQHLDKWLYSRINKQAEQYGNTITTKPKPVDNTDLPF